MFSSFIHNSTCFIENRCEFGTYVNSKHSFDIWCSNSDKNALHWCVWARLLSGFEIDVSHNNGCLSKSYSIQMENDKKTNNFWSLGRCRFHRSILPLSLLSHWMRVLQQQNFLFRWFCQVRNIQHAQAFRLAFVLRQLLPRSSHSFCELFFTFPAIPRVVYRSYLILRHRLLQIALAAHWFLDAKTRAKIFQLFTLLTLHRNHTRENICDDISMQEQTDDWFLLEEKRFARIHARWRHLTKRRPIRSWNHVFQLHSDRI